MSVVKIACIQTNSTPEPDENIASVSDLIREASASGAQIITTPEAVSYTHLTLPTILHV